MLNKKGLVLFLVLSLVIAVTGVFAQDVELPDVTPLEYADSDIIMAGSSTVFPLAEKLAEVWEEEGGKAPTISSIGSGAGFERFCVNAETDISNASRPIRESEIESCRENGREPIEIRVGTDALAVTMSIANTTITDLSIDQLAFVFSDERDENGDVVASRTWADINADWPAEPIERFIPGTDSGTYDYFVEAIFEGLYEAMEEGEMDIADPFIPADFQTEDGENLMEAIAAAEEAGDEDLLDALEERRDAAINSPILSATNTDLSEDDNVLVQGIQGSEYAIGFFGYAYYAENTDVLNILMIEGVEASNETVDDNSYPLSRPLFMYSDAGIMAEKPQVAAFLNFVLTNVNDYIVEVGYFPANAEVLDAARQAWLDANEGME